MAPKDEFIPKICELKHDGIDKDLKEIKNDIEEIKNGEKEGHKDIKKMIVELFNEVKTSHINLKNKIVLVNKAMGDKIDNLNDFDKELRGNGDPGIWECVRNIKRNVKIMMISMLIFIILLLGGKYRGISLESLQKMFSFGRQKTKQVEPDSKIIKEVPKIKISKE